MFRRRQHLLKNENNELKIHYKDSKMKLDNELKLKDRKRKAAKRTADRQNRLAKVLKIDCGVGDLPAEISVEDIEKGEKKMKKKHLNDLASLKKIKIKLEKKVRR